MAGDAWPPPEAIQCFIPKCNDPQELDLRRRLLRARDFASGNLWQWRDTCPDLFSIYRVIAAVAGEAVFAPIPTAALETTWLACRRLLSAAGLIEQLEVQRHVE